jgi:DNA-binding SARP family transcriptional activator
LHLLALHAPRPVHREVLVDCLWPEADAATGTRNLQVAISSLRALLEPGVARGAYTLLVREGDAYRLALPPGADADVASFEEALAVARLALARGDLDAAAVALREAVDRYAGDLLPEDGPAEWVVKRREGARGEAADAAARLAEIERDRGDIRAALAACEAGLRIDRYRDSLWRLKSDALRSAGNDAAASRTEQAYQAMLDELGISAD